MKTWRKKMANFIDRNSEDMRAYAKSVNEYAANMTQLIRATQGSLAFYESELDDKCKSCIAKLNTDCNDFLRQVDAYHQLANQIEKKANKLDEVRNSIRF